jgi:hypothetical protein
LHVGHGIAGKDQFNALSGRVHWLLIGPDRFICLLKLVRVIRNCHPGCAANVLGEVAAKRA